MALRSLKTEYGKESESQSVFTSNKNDKTVSVTSTERYGIDMNDSTQGAPLSPANTVDALSDVTSTIFCSIVGDDRASKIKVFNAISNAKPLKGEINNVLNIVDVIGQNVRIKDKKSGEIRDDVRVVLVAEDGTAYGTISSGVMNSLKNLFALVGKPHWAEPLPLRVLSKTGNNGYDFLALEIAE